MGAFLALLNPTSAILDKLLPTKRPRRSCSSCNSRARHPERPLAVAGGSGGSGLAKYFCRGLASLLWAGPVANPSATGRALPGVFYALCGGVKTIAKPPSATPPSAKEASGNGVFTASWFGAKASALQKSRYPCVGIR